MFQLSNVARRSFSRGLITGRVKISQISKFNNSLKELKDDVKNVSKKLNEIETKVQEDVKKVSKKLDEIETKVQDVSEKMNEIETKVREVEVHVKYLPVQTTAYVCGTLVAGSSLLAAIGWGVSLETN